MRLREIIYGYDAVREDIDAVVKAADHSLDAAKRQKTQAEITSLRKKASDKQRQLASPNKAAHPQKPA